MECENCGYEDFGGAFTTRICKVCDLMQQVECLKCADLKVKIERALELQKDALEDLALMENERDKWKLDHGLLCDDFKQLQLDVEHLRAERNSLRKVVEAARVLDARLTAANLYTAVLAMMREEILALNDALRVVSGLEESK